MVSVMYSSRIATNLSKLHLVSCIMLFCLLLVGLTEIANARPWTPADDVINGVPIPGNVQYTVHSDEIGHLSLTFSRPVIKMEQLELLQQSWTLPMIEGETRSFETGTPALPVIVRTIRLPNKGNIQTKITSIKYDEIDQIDLLPQQSLTDPNQFAFDSVIYQTDAWYPQEILQTGLPAILRDARITTLAYYPIQYNPVQRKIRIATEISIESIPTGGQGINELLSAPKPVPSFAVMYRDILGADDLIETNRNAKPGQILIIAKTNAQVQTTLAGLIDWKIASGHPTQLVTLANATAATDVQTVIANAYNSYDPPLEYVLLVGEGGTSGTMLPTHFRGAYATDHPYQQLIGSDILADVSVSRLSFSSVIPELQTIVNRVVFNEKNPSMADTSWFTRGWGYAGTSHEVYSIAPAIRFCISMMNQRGISNVPYDEHGAHVDPALIQTRLGSGATFWFHRPAWLGEIIPSDLTNISNVNKPFVSINLTCESGTWYGSITGVQEALTRLGTPSQPRGAIAAMATESSQTHPSANNCIATGSAQALGLLNASHPSELYLNGKYHLWRNINPFQPTTVDSFSYWNNVMGDASAVMWTGVPKTITANIPEQLSIGDNRLAISVTANGSPAPNALITAWKKNGTSNETYVRASTDSSGNAILALTNVTPGNLIVTVTSGESALNYKSIVDTVAIISGSEDVGINQITLADQNGATTSGNGDGICNPNETVDVIIQLINRGTESLPTVSGTLTSNDPRVTVLSGNGSWPTISSGSTANNFGVFKVRINAGLRDQEIVQLPLLITGGSISHTLTIPLTIRSLAIQFRSYNVIGATRLNPGGTVDLSLTLMNSGGLSLTSPTIATMTSLHRMVTVGSPTATFQTIPAAAEFSNSATSVWTVSANRAAVPGTMATLQVIFHNGLDLDSIRFPISIGNIQSSDPTGPDGYGYSAVDNSDIDYPLAPTYNWVEINPNNGGPGSTLPIHDNAYTHDTTGVIALPFPVKYYGHRFDSLTICSNGWAAFGNQLLYNNFRNWPLPSTEGPRNMLAAMWDELYFNSSQNQGVYTYYDAVHHKFIITWNVTTLYSSHFPVEFQIQLFDPAYYRTPTGDAKIVFQYKKFHNVNQGDPVEPNFCTVGIADGNYTNALQLSYYDTYTNGSARIPNSDIANYAVLFTTESTDTLLHVIAPTIGDTLLVGYPVQILWQGRRSIDSVRIELNRNYPSGNWETLIASTLNDGQESWVVEGASSFNSRIRVTTRDILEGDTSRFSFPMIAPEAYIHITAPDSGEPWTITTQRAITWDHPPMVGTVKIELNRNYPDGNWVTLFDSIPAITGSALWTVTSPLSSTARIRVISNQIIDIGDTSAVNFSIVSKPHLSHLPNPAEVHLLPTSTQMGSLSIVNTGGSEFNGTIVPNLGFDGYGWARNTDPGGPAYHWVDITDEGEWIEHGDDVVSDSLPLGFSFPFYGSTFEAVWVCTNGWITFTDPGDIASHMNRLLPYFELGPMLAVYWDHVIVPDGGLLFYRDTVNHRVIFEWKNCWVYRDSTSRLTFEAIINQDGTIEYIYSRLRLNTVDQTVGLQSQGAVNFFNIYRGVQIASPHIIRFTPMEPWGQLSNLNISVPPGGELSIPTLWDPRRFALHDTVRGSVTVNGFGDNTPYTFAVRMIIDGTRVAEQSALPSRVELAQNYPNPFNPATEIVFRLDQQYHTKLEIFDITGASVAVLLDQPLSAGQYQFRYDGSKLASGVYFYRLQAGPHQISRKMVFVK